MENEMWRSVSHSCRRLVSRREASQVVRRSGWTLAIMYEDVHTLYADVHSGSLSKTFTAVVERLTEWHGSCELPSFERTNPGCCPSQRLS